MLKDDLTSRICKGLDAVDDQRNIIATMKLDFRQSEAFKVHKKALEAATKELRLREADLAEFRKDARELRIDEEVE